MSARNENGVALFLVLSLIMVAAVFAGLIMNFTLSQVELTRHKTDRIKAYYAALAGMNLAFEKLRSQQAGWWNVTSSHTLCQSGCDVNDPMMPYPVTINITQTSDVTRYNLTISVDYTSSLPSFRGR